MRFLLAIPAALYGFVLHIRHGLFNTGIIRGYRAGVPVVCVGNITVGGTGKTPAVEFLVDRLSEDCRIAVLSRGYGRRTKGYIEVKADSPYRDVGDEPKMIKQRFPRVIVAVCEKRAEGIRRIMTEHPDVEMIIMDDGFQHRRVKPSVNIILMDYNRPVYRDRLLPWGRLRDLRSQMDRANIVIVTKTPETMTPIERRLIVKKLRLYPYQSLFFTSMNHGSLRPVFPEAALNPASTKNIAVMSGIGNPGPLSAELGKRYNIVATYTFPDHHAYKKKELEKIGRHFATLPPDTILVTTEKDGVKLTNRRQVPEEIRRRLFVVPVKLSFFEGDREKFIKTLYRNVKEN